MACFSGPEIVNDRLVFHFDLENGVKSWKGKPTTNLASGRVSSGNGNVPTINVSDILPDGTVGSVKEHSAEFIVDVNRTVSFGQFTLTQGSTYTISFYVKNIDCTGFAMTFFYYDPGAIYMGYAKSYTADVIQNEWVRITQTFTVPVLSSGTTVTVWPQIFRDGGYGKFRLTYPQLEEGTITTKFVNGIRLDTASIIDISPAKNTITASNLTYRQDDTPTFDGTDDFLTISNFPRFASDSDLTIEAFVKPTGMHSYSVILSRGYGSAGYPNYNLGRQNRAGWRFSVGDNTSNYSATDTDFVVQNVWQHVVGVLNRSDNTCKIYLNGELKSTGDATGIGSFENAAGNLTIGRSINNVSYSYFIGDMSIIKLYSKSLTESEIQQNFEATRSRYGI